MPGAFPGLHEALPESPLVRRTPTADSDGHVCPHREEAAWEVFGARRATAF